MNENKVLKSGTVLVYLASCSLSGETPKQKIMQEIDGEAIYRLSKFHSMEGICKLAIDRYLKDGGVLSESLELIYPKFKLRYENAVKKLVAFSFEREALFAYFSELKMQYLPLKGIIISTCYPAIGMRQMTDNDILIDPKQAKRIRNYMQNRGYSVESYGKGCHDTYCKGALTFELHRKLIPSYLKDGDGARFCREATERARNNSKGALCLSFSNEDFYLYMLLHAYKHFESAGIGIRALMDIYVFRHLSGFELDQSYIEKELTKIGILPFAEAMATLSDLLFATPTEKLFDAVESLSPEMTELFLLHIKSGAFGTDTQQVRNRLKKVAKGKRISSMTKAKYLIFRIFPPYSLYRERYPRLSKWIITIPFLWFARLFSALFSPENAMRELENLKDAESSDKDTR